MAKQKSEVAAAPDSGVDTSEWTKLEDERIEVEEWLDADEVTKAGAKLVCLLEGALVVPDDKTGGTRVCYGVRLPDAEGPEGWSKTVYGVGERYGMRALRDLPAGAVVSVESVGTKNLPGKRTLTLFDIRVSPKSPRGGKRLGDVIAKLQREAGPTRTGPGVGGDGVAF